MLSELGVCYVFLFYKFLEIEKDKYLKVNVGDFEVKIVIFDKNKEMIVWWIDNVEWFLWFINVSKLLLVINLKIDSLMIGWGVFNENNGDCY